MKRPNIITPEHIAEFFKLPQAEAERVWGELERLEYRNGEDIVRFGDAADGMYFLDDGTVDVLDRDGNPVNEMHEGQYFGEYAVISEEPRLTTVRARGKVIAYRMSSAAFLGEISRRPTFVGYLLKQVYSQLSMKHSKLLEIARERRGILHGQVRKDMSRRELAVTYGITALLFLFTGLFVPKADPGPFWLLVPLLFLVIFTLWTRRTLEALVLTVMLASGVANGGNFLQGFTDALAEGIAVPDTASTIVIMCLIGAVTTLLSAAGGISALRRPAEARIKTGRGALFSMIGIMAVIFIDDCLNVLSAAFCLVGITDRNRVPREVPAFIGSFSTSICALIPLSVWGAYVSGTVSLSLGRQGGDFFLKALPWNLAALLGVGTALLAAAGLLPRIRLLRDAERRVREGGELWPKGAEKYFLANDDKEIYGHPGNLLMPLAVTVTVSALAGTMRTGAFALDAAAGLTAALLFMFVSYVGQRLMTPERFLDCAVEGMQSTVLPILLLLLTLCFSTCLEQLHFTQYVERIIPMLSSHHPQYLPMLLYIIFTGFTLLLGSSWGMYGIGIPVACQLARLFGVDLPVCLGAVFAAGITGDNLCPYIQEGAMVASAVGCDPKVNRDIRVRYWAVIAVLCTVLYFFAGRFAAYG